MPNMDVIRRLEMRADVPGASEAAAQLRNLQGGFEAMQRAAEAATKSVEKNGQTVISTDRQYQNFLRRTVPGFREFEQFTRDVNMLDAALSQGRGIQEFGRNFDLARQRLPEVRAEMVRMREESAAIDRALEQTQRRIAASAASWEEYQERIAAARHAQNSAEFGRATNERLGVGVPSATNRGASYSALAEREAAIVAAHKAAEDEITRAVRDQRVEYERLSRVRSEMLQRSDPLGAAQERYNQMLVEANALRQKGLLTEEQHAKVIASETLTMRNIQRDFGEGKAGFRAYQQANLRYQFIDIGQGIMQGMPLSMVATQQLPQLGQILGDHKGGLRGGVKALAQDLLGLVTPARIAFGGISAAVLGGAAGWYRYDTSLKAVEQSLYGIGRASGVTATQVDQMARALPSSSGVSTHTARSTIARALGTGEIGADVASAIGRDARNFGNTTGQSFDDAEKEMIAAFANIGQGIDVFVSKVGGISPRVQQAIKDMADMGDKAGANRLAISALTGQLTPYTEQLTALGAAWDKTKIAGSEFLDVVGRKIDLAFGFGPLEDQLANLRSNLESIKALGPLYIFGDQAATEKRIRDLEALIEKRKAAQIGVADSKRAGLLEADIRATMPDIEAERILRVGATRLRNRTQDQAALGLLSPEAAAQAAAAEERWRLARESFIITDQRLAEQQQINLRSVMALTAGQEAGIAADQKRLEAKGDITKAYRAEADAVNAATLVYARYEKAAQDALRQSGYSLRSAGMLPYQRAVTDLRSQMEEELLRNQGNSPEMQRARADIMRRFAIEMRRTNIDQIGGPLQQSKLSLNEQIASLEVQAKSFYANAEAAGTFAAKQELTNQYLRAGITPTGALAREIDDLAARYGKAAGEADKFARTSQNIVQGMDEIRSGSRSALTGLFSDLRQGKDWRQGLLNASNRAADQLFDRVISKPLVESAFGFDGKGGGGWFGDFVSKSGIFGTINKQGIAGLAGLAPTTTATMNVTAANVIISAGLGGLGIPGVTGPDGAGGAALGATGTNIGGGAGGVLAAMGAALTGRTIVRDGSGRILSYGSGGSGGGLPISVSPSSRVDPTTDASALRGVPIENDLPNWLGRNVPWFRETPANSGSYLPDGSRGTQGPLYWGMIEQKENMLSQTAERAAQSLDKVGASGNDAANGLLSLVRGSGGLGSLFGSSAQASSYAPMAQGGDMYATGGYTGSGGRYEPAGVVHRGEYVFSAPAVSRIGLGALDAMHRGVPGYAEGGFVGASIVGPQPVALPPMPTPALAAVPAPGLSGASHSGPQQISLQVDVTGARGNAEITEMVHRGVAAGLEQYDRKLNRTLPGRLAEHQRRFG